MAKTPPITGNEDLDAFLYDVASEINSTITGSGVIYNETNGEITDAEDNVIGYIYRYIHIKYADDNIGTGIANVPLNKNYFGIRNSDSATENNNPADYRWYAVSGGFGSSKSLFYKTTGNRTIRFDADTAGEDYTWVVDPGDAIDLDILVPIRTISFNEIMDNTITELKIADAAVTAAKTNIAAIEPSTGALIANSVGTTQITDDAISAQKIQANAIVAGKIAANAVTASTIEAGSVIAVKIAADAVTADKINVNELSAISANMGTITAGSITTNLLSSGTSTVSGGTFALGSSTAVAGLSGTGIFTRSASLGFGLAGVNSGSGSGSAGVVGASTSLSIGTWGVLGYYTNSSYSSNYGVGGLGSYEYGAVGRYYSGGSSSVVPAYEGRLGSSSTAVQAYKQSSGDYFNLVQSGWLGVAYRGGTASIAIGQLPSGYAVYSIAGAGKGYFVDGIGPFTGVHDGVVESSFEAEVGDILIDVEFLHAVDVSNTIVKMQKSTMANQKGVVGVFIEKLDEVPHNWKPTIPKYPNAKPSIPLGIDVELTPEEPEEITEVPNPEYYDIGDYAVVNINSLGEGMINVCGEGGDIEIGDLIVTSSIPGKGMKQSDDLIRNITVAKSRTNITFSSPTEVKQIACIYLAG